MSIAIGMEREPKVEVALQRVFSGTVHSGRKTAQFIYKIFKTVNELPFFIAYFIVMLLFLPLSFLMTLALFPFTWWAKSEMRKAADLLESRANSGDYKLVKPRQAMIFLSEAANYRQQIEKLIVIGSPLYVFRPINIQFSQLADEIRRIEKCLEPAVYPNREKISDEEAKELASAFKGWEEGWMNTKMECYN